MNIEGIYPGQLIHNLRVVNQPRSMNIELVSNEQPSQMYHLDYRYYNGNIEDLLVDDVLQGPFVVLDFRDNGYRVAQAGYFDKLFSHIYPEPGGWDTPVTTIPWMVHWKKIFLPNFDPDKLTFSSYPQKDALELKTPWAVIPLRVSSFLRFIDKKPVVYPDNLLSSEKIKNAQYAAYCSDEIVNWPLSYTATFHHRVQKVEINKAVRVCLHGFLDPLQNHYKLWKHITDDSRVVMNSDALNRWGTYTGVSIPPTLKNVIFNKCKPPVPYNLHFAPWSTKVCNLLSKK